jgi:hypothetical protein
MKYLITLLILTVFSSCENEGRNAEIDIIDFELSRDKPEGGMSQCYASFVVQDTTFFIQDDIMSNRLIIYSFIDNQKVDWVTKSYPETWSRSLNKRFYLRGTNDFFVLDNKSRLFHFKEDSVYLKSVLNQFNPYVRVSGLFLSQNNEFFVDSSENVTTRVFYSEADSIKPSNYFEPVTAIFNTKNETVELKEYDLPQKFKSKYKGMYNAYNQNYSKKDTIIYWSSIEEKITIVDLINKKEIDKVLRSKFQVNDFHDISFAGTPENRDDFYLESIEQGRYAYLIYNPFLKLYYRVFQHPISREKYFESNRKNGGYSVMILNNQLNLIDEIRLADDIETVFVLIPTKKGLLINTSEGFVPIDTNDKLRFLRIKL